MFLLDKILDSTILYSFDKSGYLRHKEKFNDQDLNVSLEGKTCLITGANSGIGLAISKKFAEKGARVHMLCRNIRSGKEAVSFVERSSGNKDVFLEVIDLSSISSVKKFVKNFLPNQVDVLIQNAGLMPREEQMSEDGFEMCAATHVIGPHLLTRLLINKFNNSRIIWVSTGGMYLAKFNMKSVFSKKSSYNPIFSYVVTKRAQVILSELWSSHLSKNVAVVNSVHPGWVDTKGLKYALPKFWKFFSHNLRTAEQGADCIVWLSIAKKPGEISGSFWFDRKQVSANPFGINREKKTERAALWNFCNKI